MKHRSSPSFADVSESKRNFPVEPGAEAQPFESQPAPVALGNYSQSTPEQTGARRRATHTVGRYEVHQCIAAGGMATVHLGRLRGAAGFSRTVAIKRLLPSFAMDPEFKEMFIDEAHVAARIQHANVASTLDVVSINNELLLVMEYIDGETLAKLTYATVKQGHGVAYGVTVSVLADALRGLHAAHTASDRHGNSLGIVHRDVSPQNVMVGVDGSSRVLDFGIAKATDSSHTTREGLVKGKTGYMAPEQIYSSAVSAQTDVYAIGVLLWELLTCERLYPKGARPELIPGASLDMPSPLDKSPDIPPELAAVAVRALQRRPEARFESAQAMAEALEAAYPPASRAEVASWVRNTAAEALGERAALVAQLESADSIPPPAPGPAPSPESSVPAPSRTARRIVLVVAALMLVAGGVAAGVVIARTPTAEDQTRAAPRAAEAAAPGATAAAANGQRSESANSAASGVVNGAAVTETTPSAPTVIDLDREPATEAKTQPVESEATVTEPSQRARPRVLKRQQKKANCTPPYTIDGAGRKHYKAECF